MHCAATVSSVVPVPTTTTNVHVGQQGRTVRQLSALSFQCPPTTTKVKLDSKGALCSNCQLCRASAHHHHQCTCRTARTYCAATVSSIVPVPPTNNKGQVEQQGSTVQQQSCQCPSPTTKVKLDSKGALCSNSHASAPHQQQRSSRTAREHCAATVMPVPLTNNKGQVGQQGSTVQQQSCQCPSPTTKVKLDSKGALCSNNHVSAPHQQQRSSWTARTHCEATVSSIVPVPLTTTNVHVGQQGRTVRQLSVLSCQCPPPTTKVK